MPFFFHEMISTDCERKHSQLKPAGQVGRQAPPLLAGMPSMSGNLLGRTDGPCTLSRLMRRSRVSVWGVPSQRVPTWNIHRPHTRQAP